MSNLKYNIAARSADRIQKGQKGYFDWELTNRYGEIAQTDAQDVAQMSNFIAQTVADNAEPQGELTVTLSSWIDDVEQAPLVYQMTRAGLSQAQIELFTAGSTKQFLAKSHSKQKAKAAGWKPPKGKKDASELLGEP